MQIKIYDIFHISAQNINCGYSVELDEAVLLNIQNLCLHTPVNTPGLLTWGLGRAAFCDCGTPWTFLLLFAFTNSLKALLQQGISELKFYGDLVYRFRKIVGKSNFSEQFRKLINRYKRIGYSLDIIQQTAQKG